MEFVLVLSLLKHLQSKVKMTLFARVLTDFRDMFFNESAYGFKFG